AWRHADLLKRRDGLGTPGRPWLAVTDQRRKTEDAAHIRSAAAFASDKFGDSIQKTGVGEILGRGRVNGMKIGVIADVMLLEGSDDIGAAAPLQRPGFFANDFERGSNSLGGEQLGKAFGGIVTRRQQIIFSIKPKYDKDRGIALILRDGVPR